MGDLEVKKVSFMGAELMAARDEDGQIWAGVRWMCNGIGLSKGQTNGEITKIGTDDVLKEGNTKFRIPTNSGIQETLCLKLDFVPLWLAKISITPAMKRKQPEIAEKLKQYQLKAKDVLAEAFISPHIQQQEDDLTLLSRAFLVANKQMQEQAVKIEALETQIEEEKPLTEFAKSVSECSDTVTVGEYAKMLFSRDGIDIGRNRLYKWLRNHGYLSEKNEPYQMYVTDGLFAVKLTYSGGNVYPVTLVTGKGMVKLFPQIADWWEKHNPDVKKQDPLELDQINQYILEAKAKGYTERRMADEIGTISNAAVHKRIDKLRRLGLLNS